MRDRGWYGEEANGKAPTRLGFDPTGIACAK